jgi:ribosomal protein L14
VGAIINNQGEMKGSSIIGPVAKECVVLGLRILFNATSVACFFGVCVKQKQIKY